jgi:GntR family transcriptional repressor for pyruvate dehydrogenase complex
MAATRARTGGSDARTLAAGAAAEIRRRLASGELGVGERLPPERVLTEELGGARTVLREALSSLEALGLIEARPTRGRYVTAGSPERSRLLVSAWLHQHARQIGDFDEIRAMAEAHALRTLSPDDAREAARRAAPILEEQVEAVARGDAVAAATADAELHRALCSLSANGALRALVDGLIEQLARAALAVFSLPAAAAQSLAQHEAILAALEAGEAAAAARLIEAHHSRGGYAPPLDVVV